MTHGTLRFTLSEKNYKIGIALVNKSWLTTRLKNQLINAEGINSYRDSLWYIKDIVEDSEELQSIKQVQLNKE